METTCCFEEELAEGQLYRIQEKHHMLWDALDDKRRIRREKEIQTSSQTETTLLF